MFIHIPNLNRADSLARLLRKHTDLSLSKAAELVAEMHGYENRSHFQARWSELNRNASTSAPDRRSQFLKVLKAHPIANVETIIDLIAPLETEEPPPSIVLTQEDFQKEYAKLDPRTKEATMTLEALYKQGDHYRVIVEALKILKTVGIHQQPRFFALIESCQRSTPEIALFASGIYTTKGVADPGYSTAIDLLEYALTSSLPDIVLNAHYGLGVALRERDQSLAKQHMLIAARGGIAVAEFAVALGHQTGSHGFDENVELAVKMYIDLHKAHKHPLAALFLAKAILFQEQTQTKYDPRSLLEGLATAGNAEARILLNWMRVTEHRKNRNSKVPNRLTPPTNSRPKLVREALIAQFKLEQNLAEAITSALYGHDSWNSLMIAINKKTDQAPEDEACSESEVLTRRNFQALVLADYIGLDEPTAKLGIELLQPTGTLLRPSLKPLEQLIRRNSLQDRLGPDFNSVRNIATMLSGGKDPEQLMSWIYRSAPKK
jgi:hypothetical protein